MSRVKGGFKTRRRRNRTLKLAKGYWGAKSKLYRTATEAVDTALNYAYRDRRTKKRDFRKLWIIRINAGARENGLSYSMLMNGLKKGGVDINRKILSDLAISDPKAFTNLVQIAKENMQKQEASN